MTTTSEPVSFASALGRIPSGLFILTTGGQASTGMLVSWVQQCSFEPPLVSVAIQRDRPVLAELAVESPFVLNLLAEDQKSLIGHFARGFAPGADPWNGIATEPAPTGVPILKAALAYLECRVVQHHRTGGDHDLIVSRIVGGALSGEGKPYVHIRKNGLSY